MQGSAGFALEEVFERRQTRDEVVARLLVAQHRIGIDPTQGALLSDER